MLKTALAPADLRGTMRGSDVLCKGATSGPEGLGSVLFLIGFDLSGIEVSNFSLSMVDGAELVSAVDLVRIGVIVIDDFDRIAGDFWFIMLYS